MLSALENRPSTKTLLYSAGSGVLIACAKCRNLPLETTSLFSDFADIVHLLPFLTWLPYHRYSEFHISTPWKQLSIFFANLADWTKSLWPDQVQAARPVLQCFLLRDSARQTLWRLTWWTDYLRGNKLVNVIFNSFEFKRLPDRKKLLLNEHDYNLPDEYDY